MKTEIHLIITKYLSSQASQEEIDLLVAWIEESEANRNTFDQLKRIWEHRMPDDRENEAREILAQVNARIKVSSAPRNAPGDASRKTVFFRHPLFKVAASITLLALCITTGTLLYRSFSGSLFNEYETVRTLPGKKQQVVLPDSSVVFLNSNSSIRFPEKFNGESREVFIEGEAFLDVRHLEDQPFIVHTQHVSTRVLGTRFNICSRPGENQLRVSLVEGKVSIINEQEPESPIILLPEEEVIIDMKTDVTVKQHFKPENTTAWTDGTLIFSNETMAEIARKITAWYAVKVVFRNEDLLKCRFRGKFHNETLENILETMQKTGVITYEFSEDNNMVYLNGKGCMDTVQ